MQTDTPLNLKTLPKLDEFIVDLTALNPLIVKKEKNYGRYFVSLIYNIEETTYFPSSCKENEISLRMIKFIIRLMRSAGIDFITRDTQEPVKRTAFFMGEKIQRSDYVIMFSTMGLYKCVNNICALGSKSEVSCVRNKLYTNSQSVIQLLIENIERSDFSNMKDEKFKDTIIPEYIEQTYDFVDPTKFYNSFLGMMSILFQFDPEILLRIDNLKQKYC